MLHDSFLIRIRRRNLVEQIVSFYIELYRRVWGYYSTSVYDNINNSIPLENSRANSSITHIISYNTKLNNCKYKFNLDLYYEDLKFTNDELIQTPKPPNYIEVYEFIKKKLPKTLIEN